MPLASLSVSRDLLGDRYTPTLGGDWFARFTAALMFGAAIGGILLGSLGDRIGRARAMGISILFYSVFAGLGAWVQTQEQMLVLRFMVGLGVGGVWPNAVALVAECWPDKARPTVAGVDGCRDQRRHPDAFSDRAALVAHRGLLAVAVHDRGRARSAGPAGVVLPARIAGLARHSRT